MGLQTTKQGKILAFLNSFFNFLFQSIYTKEDENSCEAALFSCDLAFAEQMFGSRELAQAGSGQWFNGFDENESCTNLPAIGGDDSSDSSAMSQGRFVAVEHQCCGGNGNPL